MPTIHEINAELHRTAFQKTAVVKLTPTEVFGLAHDFFGERGYRAKPTGRPGYLLVLGGAEGLLPRVTGEIGARQNVGKPGTTLVTVDAAGERLGPTMKEFLGWLRAQDKALRAAAGD